MHASFRRPGRLVLVCFAMLEPEMSFTKRAEEEKSRLVVQCVLPSKYSVR